MSLVVQYLPAVLGSRGGSRPAFLLDDIDEEEAETQASVLYNSSDAGMSESESFVSESSGEIPHESDFDDHWCGEGSSDDDDRRVISSAPAANMCIITGEYSSSYSDAIEGLDTDIPVLDPCDDFVDSGTKSNMNETTQETPDEFVM